MQGDIQKRVELFTSEALAKIGSVQDELATHSKWMSEFKQQMKHRIQKTISIVQAGHVLASTPDKFNETKLSLKNDFNKLERTLSQHTHQSADNNHISSIDVKLLEQEVS